jgi:catechol O-methyltransferase
LSLKQPEKGAFLDDFLRQSVEAYHQLHGANKDRPFVLVEVGTYCGYSCTRLAQTIQTVTNNFHILTVDVNAKNQAVAKELLTMAGYGDCVSFLLLPESTEANALAQRVGHEMDTRFPGLSVDFVFLDHVKELYLADLRSLESTGLIKAGCHVAADNVVIFQLEEYRQYMQQLATVGVVETALRLGHLEYIDLTKEAHLEDGLECSVYLKDPPSI